MNRFHIKDKGFTLAEIMVAVFIITIGVLGVAPLLNSVISTNILARDISIATHLARERIEEIKTWPRYNYDPTISGNGCGIQIQNPDWGGNGNCDETNPDGTIADNKAIKEIDIKVGEVPQFFTRITEIRSNINLPADQTEPNHRELIGEGMLGDTTTYERPPLEYRIVKVTVQWTTPFEVDSDRNPRVRSITQMTSVSEF